MYFKYKKNTNTFSYPINIKSFTLQFYFMCVKREPHWKWTSLGWKCEYVMTHVSQHQAVIYNTNPRQQHFLSMLKKIKEEIFCQLHRITYKIIANCKKIGVVLCYIVTYESVIIDTGIFKITFVPFDWYPWYFNTWMYDPKCI